MISLYDTASRRVSLLETREAGKVSIYVCGPTVYSAPHIGHGRQVIVYDILRRYLTWTGLEVTFVSNITDIDDKIIEQSQAENIDSAEVAVVYEAAWWRAMDRLNALRPDHTPHATEYVDQMVELIEELIGNGSAYATSDGVYLSVETVDGYGLLANQDLDSLREGGGDREVVGIEKGHPSDFALWKLAKPGEPSWPSPWGEGRPGWHTECVVMSLDILGEGFDLHTGGLDLTFPHHENERAQAVALDRTFAQKWVHHGFVEMDGEKMSKSLGNVFNLIDLTEKYDPRSYRLLISQSHYRSPIEVTDVTMSSASAAIQRLDTFAQRVTGDLDAAAAAGSPVGPSAEVMKAFSTAMDNDLDSPGAVDLLFRQVREANTLLDSGESQAALVAAATALEIGRVLGLEFDTAVAEVPAEIAALAEERKQARNDRDFAKADALRDQLVAAGWAVEDGSEGQVLKPVGAG